MRNSNLICYNTYLLATESYDKFIAAIKILLKYLIEIFVLEAKHLIIVYKTLIFQSEVLY